MCACVPSGSAHAPQSAAGVRACGAAATALGGRRSGSASAPWPPHRPAAGACSAAGNPGQCSVTGAIADEGGALLPCAASGEGDAAGILPWPAASPPKTPCSPCKAKGSMSGYLVLQSCAWRYSKDSLLVIVALGKQVTIHNPTSGATVPLNKSPHVQWLFRMLCSMLSCCLTCIVQHPQPLQMSEKGFDKSCCRLSATPRLLFVNQNSCGSVRTQCYINICRNKPVTISRYVNIKDLQVMWHWVAWKLLVSYRQKCSRNRNQQHMMQDTASWLTATSRRYKGTTAYDADHSKLAHTN